jgi:hypothetical protein
MKSNPARPVGSLKSKTDVAESLRMFHQRLFIWKATMLNFLTKWMSSLRARNRWKQGRCPLCDRNLYAVYSHQTVSHPPCFCVGETHANGQFWNKYLRALTISQDKGLQRTASLNEERIVTNEGDSKAQTIRKDDRAAVVRWEGEGGSVCMPEALISR